MQNTLCTIAENTTPNQMVTQTVPQNFDGRHTTNSASSTFYFGNATNRLSIGTSALPDFSFQGNTTTTQHGTTPQQESVCSNSSRPSKRRRSETEDSFDSQAHD